MKPKFEIKKLHEPVSPVYFHIPTSQLERVNKRAESERKTRTDVLRQAVEAYLSGKTLATT